MAQTGVVSWSKTAANNATADSNVNWAEGMAPSQVNDSARAEMASVAKWRDDNSGRGNVTSGTATAYTWTSDQGFSSLAAMDGARLCITFDQANGPSPTLSVDGLAAKPIFTGPGLNGIPVGFIPGLSNFDLVYLNGSGGFGIIGETASGFLPPAMISPYAGSSAPLGWLICDGTGYSRVTYAALFSAIGTTYGSSDGASFKVPDLGGRVPAGKEASASRLTSGNSGVDGGTLGASGGSQLMQQHNHGVTDSGHTHTIPSANTASFSAGGNGYTQSSGVGQNTGNSVTGISINNAGSGASQNVQPTLILNYIIKT